jgi:hypothetical protein
VNRNKEPKPVGSAASSSWSPSCYRAYLLRLWRGETDKPWRFSIIPAGTQDQIQHFANIEGLMHFLLTQMEETGDP